MRLREFDESANSALKLAALSQFLSDRAEAEAASKQIIINILSMIFL